jgi:hypothetical protein
MKGNAMSNDEEAARLVAGWLRDQSPAVFSRSGVEDSARDLLSKLSRLEQSRVERALSTCERLLKAWHHNEHVVCCVEQVRDALTAPIDSSAGSPEKSDPDVRTVTGEPGGRSSRFDAARSFLMGFASYVKDMALVSISELDTPARLLLECIDGAPPPAEVKPSDCPIVLPEILARNIIRDAERMGDADRWRFLDEAAMRILPHVSDAPTAAANIAYNCAEVLWAERQKRIDEQHARGRK